MEVLFYVDLTSLKIGRITLIFPDLRKDIPQIENSIKIESDQDQVFHTCNLSYSGGRSGGWWFKVSPGK
jgi:hypothetical protein